MVQGEREARACGGCFVPPAESTVVTDHRMAFSVSTTQTVLWDQIRYTGDPKEFAWVLPVHPGARLELSRDEWFAALDASTQPRITGPARGGGGGGGGGCGIGCGSADALSATSASGEPPVQVISQEVVGPYETVTLRATDSKALEAWLSAHGYAVPPSVQPVVDAYTNEGFDFIALRLQPGQGVRAMKPVRIVTPGADLSLPLRMVAAGVGANVGITLYVISEGRYHPQNFPDVTVEDTKLVWDYTQNRSNYQELSIAAMAAGEGKGWLTEYANRPSLMASGYAASYRTPAGNPGLFDAYVASCGGYTQSRIYGQDFDASLSDGATDAGPTEASVDASNDAPNEALADAAMDDAAPDAGPSYIQDAGTTVCGTGNACCDFDDLSVAIKGLHTSDVWVTRLRANLPANALKTGDLRLEASRMQTPFDNNHYASATTEARATSAGLTASSNRAVGSYVTMALAALAVSGMLRRRRR